MTTPEVPQTSVPPTTTRQQDMTLKGQRQVNIIWEVTQAVIAVTITIAVVVVEASRALSNIAAANTSSTILANAFFLIVGFYFSRTNHQAIGGIGVKANESQEYIGR